jgi:hypothetical protein
MLICCRSLNSCVMPTSQCSRGGGATGGGGPRDPVADVANGDGDPAPEPDPAAGTVAVGASLTMTKLGAEVSSSQTQQGAATPKIVPEVGTTAATGAATSGDGDDDELEVVTRHPRLRAPGGVSLSEVISAAYLALRQCRVCSSESGPKLRKSGCVSQSGFPYSSSVPPLRGRRRW